MKLHKDSKTNYKSNKIELLAPANNKSVAIQAINSGADAVYIGYSKFGARSLAGNSLEDIEEVIKYAHQYRVKVYITINTILSDIELKEAVNIIYKLHKIKADGIIIQDMGLLECDLPDIPLIASTQCHNNSIEKIKFLEATGFKRVILPRETTLAEMKKISSATNIEIESFIHGALCVSYSGQCYLSQAIGKRSANRGECAQPCRKRYSLLDNNGNILIKEKYLLSLKDLNLSEYIEDMILSGITSFKIEGRLKNETYIKNIVSYYREKLDEVLKKLNMEKSSSGIIEKNFKPNPEKSYNRQFTSYFITGKRNKIATIDYSGAIGEPIGKIREVKKDFFIIDKNILNNGDGICFISDGNLTGTNINRVENCKIYPASMKNIKENIFIYRNLNNKFEAELKNAKIRRKINVIINLKESPNHYIFTIQDDENNIAIKNINKNFELAKSNEKAIENIKFSLLKLGNTNFICTNIDIDIKTVPFIKISELNLIRRELCEELENIRENNYNSEKRINPIKVIEYPIKDLDYKYNIHNKSAEKFYKKRNCNIKELSFETTDNYVNKALMTTKYCIKYQTGYCTKENHDKKLKEPLFLVDDRQQKYRIECNCKECFMQIYKI